MGMEKSCPTPLSPGARESLTGTWAVHPQGEAQVSQATGFQVGGGAEQSREGRQRQEQQ